jgi:hypothetical protein
VQRKSDEGIINILREPQAEHAQTFDTVAQFRVHPHPTSPLQGEELQKEGRKDVSGFTL